MRSSAASMTLALLGPSGTLEYGRARVALPPRSSDAICESTYCCTCGGMRPTEAASTCGGKTCDALRSVCIFTCMHEILAYE